MIELQKKTAEEVAKDGQVPLPDFWGGYLLEPEEFEFWQGNDIRLHDRLRYRRAREGENLDSSSIVKGENGWIIERLAP